MDMGELMCRLHPPTTFPPPPLAGKDVWTVHSFLTLNESLLVSLV